MSKAHSSSRDHPRKKTVRISSCLDPRILVGDRFHLIWRASVDLQPSKITVGRAEERTCGQQKPFVVQLSEMRHVRILKSILLIFT